MTRPEAPGSLPWEEDTMPKVLIVYGSAYGQTEKLVRRFSDRLLETGIHAVVMKGDALPPGIRLGEFDGFVVAGSVLYGKHQRYLEQFVHAHHEHLARRPSAFVSVCGAMSSGRPEGEAQAQEYRLDFIKRTGWTPRLSHSFAGGLPYTRYGLLTRMLMKAISRHNRGPVDTSRDWEFTDWDEVDRFAREFGRLVAQGAPVLTTAS